MWMHPSASNSSNDSHILFIPRRGVARVVKDLEKLYLFGGGWVGGGGRDGGRRGFYLTLNKKVHFNSKYLRFSKLLNTLFAVGNSLYKRQKKNALKTFTTGNTCK